MTELTDLTDFWESDQKGFQPLEGLEFVTYGHYGSGVFDPMDGTTLHIVVCDSCLKSAIKNKIVKKGNIS